MIYIAGILIGNWEIIGVFTDLEEAKVRVVESQTDTHPNNWEHKIEVWEFGAYDAVEVIEI